MIGRVLLLGQPLGAHDGGHNRVTEHHLNGCGRDGGQTERAQLPLQRQMNVHVADSREGIALDGGDGDERGTLGSGAGDEVEEFVGGSGFGDEDEEIAGEEGADVAVEGVDRGEVGGAGEAEGSEGLGELVGHETGLADAREKDGRWGGEEALGKGLGLGQIETVEEMVEMMLLRFEEEGEF